MGVEYDSQRHHETILNYSLHQLQLMLATLLQVIRCLEGDDAISGFEGDRPKAELNLRSHSHAIDGEYEKPSALL